MDKTECEIGIVGLGVMGRNLLLNIAERGPAAAGYDRDAEKVAALEAAAAGRPIRPAGGLEEFLGLLRSPRAVLMLVPAGPPVDAVIRELLPHLEPGDLVIDGGNSYFKDTELRLKALAEKGIRYLGMGISGGEHGARHGPSMMPGGPREGYQQVRAILEAAAAKVQGEPCVTYLGPGGAGHYVKMVHNGIEYALMQLIAESYDLLKRGLGLTDDELAAVYQEWNETELCAYLVEITAHIFRRVDEKTGKRLIDVILDEARQKGTGMWASQDAMELQIPTPAIDVAVGMRYLSVLKSERVAASQVLPGPAVAFRGDRAVLLTQLRRALYAAMIAAYAQGMAQLRRAAGAYGYGFRLEDVARVWRGGCIIRTALLEEIRAAYRARPDLASLLVDPGLAQALLTRQDDLRAVVRTAAELGIPAPGLMVALAYFDGYRSPWLPANLIEAQRDYFGAHTYERVDARGVFHTQWSAVEEAPLPLAPAEAS